MGEVYIYTNENNPVEDSITFFKLPRYLVLLRNQQNKEKLASYNQTSPRNSASRVLEEWDCCRWRSKEDCDVHSEPLLKIISISWTHCI
jgi:hypothetical protein